jgi:hypothetical protein
VQAKIEEICDEVETAYIKAYVENGRPPEFVVQLQVGVETENPIIRAASISPAVEDAQPQATASPKKRGRPSKKNLNPEAQPQSATVDIQPTTSPKKRGRSPPHKIEHRHFSAYRW